MCEITAGRAEPCKDKVGGIKNLYFINYVSSDSITAGVDGSITTIEDSLSALVDAYKYEVRFGTGLTQNIQSSRETGTTVFEQVLEATFKGMTQTQNNELKLLAQGRPRIIVEDNNGNSWLVGEEHGADLTAGTLQTGVAMTDLYGVTATFTGMERSQANFVTDLATAVNIVEPA